MGENEIVEEVKRLRLRVETLEKREVPDSEVTDLKKEIEALKKRILDGQKGINWDAPIV